MNATTRLVACAVLTAPILGAALASEHSDDVLPLPKADKEILEKFLGRGVVGDAIPGKAIADAGKLYALEAGTRTYKVVSGDGKGSTEKHELVELERDAPGASWNEKWGEDAAFGLHRDDAGNIYLVTHNEHHEGVITHYAPAEPMVLGGMKPGESRKTKSDVEVYDIANPDHLSHEGHLDLTLTYVGAYRVTVPAGSYEAVLLKWAYTGKIGPAKVNDVQYRFLAEGVGTVAEVERKKVSAMLVYSDESKAGKVLIAEN